MSAAGASRVEVLLITGGHAYDREPFLAAWQSDPEVHITHLEHPAATDAIADGAAVGFDFVVFYDMPGVDPRGQSRPTRLPPGVAEGFGRLTGEGTGLVFLHHALAPWPARYAGPPSRPRRMEPSRRVESGGLGMRTAGQQDRVSPAR
ncbi:hypothetical protein [Nocardia rhamnosiphila]|uniref:ThuA-like domain-containing protein n=1 Tax=Nocardia rhamnosiphila TaxID=426716 RepID=A0ABV2WYS8_9NOCA